MYRDKCSRLMLLRFRGYGLWASGQELGFSIVSYDSAAGLDGHALLVGFPARL